MRWRPAVALLTAAVSLEAAAVTVTIGPGQQQIGIRVGSDLATIDLVSFSIPAASMGEGTPIAGTPSLYFEVMARRGGGPNQVRTFTLSASSATPLSNGVQTIPFTTISWTTSDNDIPPGVFAGAANQMLLQFQNNRQISNTHTFVYQNTEIFPPGSYRGRVTYTLAGP